MCNILEMEKADLLSSRDEDSNGFESEFPNTSADFSCVMFFKKKSGVNFHNNHL